MGPRPYSEKASLPNDSTINESISTVPTQILPESPSPSTNSSTTTPSPTLQEVIPVEQHIDYPVIENDRRIDTVLPYYPTPDDIMPYDHSLPDFIRQITNQPNLSVLQSLSLRVISSCISLHRMAAYLPSLKELNLEGSILNSLRDIGCSFKNLQILKVNCCQLESLDGTFGLSSLRELYAQKNLINDISPCSNLPHIKHIDVSWNKIRNISYTGFLTACKKLRSIVFTGNPATEAADYRKYVRKILPQIEALDGINFENEGTGEDSEAVDNFGYESDSSSEVPDFLSVSTSDSLNNLLESEEDVNLLEKKSKQSKSVACLDQCDAAEGEVQDWDQIRLDANRNLLSVKQKPTIKQKLEKENDNRSKKPNPLSPEKNKNTEESISMIRCGSSTSFDNSAEESKFGAIKKRPATAETLHSVNLIPDKFNFAATSSLTSGLPICGNLTAALRNRNKAQNAINNAAKFSKSNDSTSKQAEAETNNSKNLGDSEGNLNSESKI